MSEYNLVKNGYFVSLTGAGEGNKALSILELEALQDGDFSTSIVTLSGTDKLHLQLDLSSRIKVDGIRLYLDSATSSGTTLDKINFYYKNRIEDSYILTSKAIGSGFYYATIPEPSAPQYIKCTISGVTGNACEFQVFNDDYIVGFGEDGQQYAEYLDDTPIGEESDSNVIKIYNNDELGSFPVSAYTAIDYTDTIADEYIKISSTEDGVYHGINDNILIKDNEEDSKYTWNMGTFTNTKLELNKVILDATTSGSYRSPIIKLDNQYEASYFLTNTTTESGITNVSFNPVVYNGTVKVRSSNTQPLQIEEIYFGHRPNRDCIGKIITYTDEVIDDPGLPGLPGLHAQQYMHSVSIDKRTGYIAISDYWNESYHGSIDATFVLCDRDFNELYRLSDTIDNSAKYKVKSKFDNSGGIWAYSTEGYLYHFNSVLGIIYQNFADKDYIADFVVERNGSGFWYIDSGSDYLYHLDYSGTQVGNIIMLNNPSFLCSNNDNGVWVINKGTLAIRYNYNGVVLKSINLERDVEAFDTDYEDGFWYISNSYLYHVNSDGVEDTNIVLPSSEAVIGGHSGCIVISYVLKYIKYINKYTGVITKSYSLPTLKTTYVDFFTFRYDDFVNNKTKLLPAPQDPVWGPSGSLEWKEVRKSGWFLPKHRFHQIETTLRSNDLDKTPYLHNITIPKAIKISDVYPQTSRNIFVKTNIPAGADITSYSSSLKCWWGKVEN